MRTARTRANGVRMARTRANGAHVDRTLVNGMRVARTRPYWMGSEPNRAPIGAQGPYWQSEVGARHLLNDSY